jgi:hypothetical protein
LTDKPYLDAIETCRKQSRELGIDAVMEQYHLDALVAPTAGPASEPGRSPECPGRGPRGRAAGAAAGLRGLRFRTRKKGRELYRQRT